MASVIKIRPVPSTQDPALQGILTDIKSAIEHLYSASPAPQPVSGLSATPIAGGVVLQFTRSNGINFRVYYGSTPNRASASIADLGSNNTFTDTVGSGGVKRYYWVEAHSPSAPSPSPIIGPVSATTLALGSPAIVTPTAVPSYQTVFDTTQNRRRPVIYGDGEFPTPPKEGAD